MLSFMREQGGENLPAEQAASGSQPNGGIPDGAENQEFLTVAANSKSLRRSTIVVAVLVAIGLAGLGYMIRKSQPEAALAKSAAEHENKLETAISRLTGVSSEMVSRMDEIVNKFYEFSDVFQVGVSELVKNPFEVEMFMGAMQEEGPVANDDAARLALIRRERLKERAANLKLLSIMRSDDGNACMINDRILYAGDTIDGLTVAEINGNSVLLAYQPDPSVPNGNTQDLTIQLKLAQ
jgi:preprotein translocase subunit SecG